jgi:hypothetical protein
MARCVNQHSNSLPSKIHGAASFVDTNKINRKFNVLDGVSTTDGLFFCVCLNLGFCRFDGRLANHNHDEHFTEKS